MTSRPCPAAPTLLALFAGSAASAGITLTPIALSGQAAPGLPGVTFARVAQPRINADGVLAFWARLEGAGITDANDGTIWTDRSGSLALAYREDGPAPFDADLRWGAFPFPAFNAEGNLSFTGALVDPADPGAPTNLGIFAEAGDGPLVAAREGAAAPGLPDGGTFDGLPVAPFGDAGAVTFNASRGAGAWLWTGGDPVPLVVTGDQAPAVGPPWQFSFIDNPADNGAGMLAFRASLVDPADPKDPRPSLWLASGGALTFIAWADLDQPTQHFTDFAIEPVVSASGAAVFWASVAGDGIDPSNDSALWSSDGGQPLELVREGQPAPGGGLFGQLPREISGNPEGVIAFAAPLTGPDVTPDTNSGIYLQTGPGGKLGLIAREGDAAPGVPGGSFSGFGPPVMSAGDHGGRIAFGAYLRGVPMGQNYALFATGAHDGAVHLIVRAGAAVDVGGGDIRTIREISFASGDAGSGYTQFAPDGALVMHLEFTDKTHGLFAASPVASCYPDLDGNGSLDLFDFLAFVNLFNASDPTADCDGNGAFDLFDFLCFVNAFNTGC